MPRLEAPSKPAPVRSGARKVSIPGQAPHSAGAGLKILTVDDDAGDRKLCQRALNIAFGDSLQSSEAASGENGLEAIAFCAPDCVLLDYSLPGINGIDVLKSIRTTHAYLPVVMIDGKGNDIVAVQSMKEGAQDYMAKATITPSTIMRAVQMAMERCALQKREHDQRTALEIFSRALAHDLKEPVRTMRSFLDRISDWRSLNENSRQSFQNICRSADHMGALIDAVHLYTRLDTATQIERAPCDLAGILGQAQENLARLIEDRAAVITSDMLPLVSADKVQMLQLFQNLLANAIEHCEGPVAVHVHMDDFGNQWLLMVRDNGPGIGADNLELIFDPFKRLSHGTGGKRGLGLGLAINRKIVETHGGKIWCESQPGEGTSFLITLPKMPGAAVESVGVSAPIASAHAKPVGQPETLGQLLVVDDDETGIELNTLFLIDQPGLRCEVQTASDGKQALMLLHDAARKGRPIDLVLLDINMPVMSGFDLLIEMKKEQMLVDTMVVICSTSDDPNDKEMAKLLGAAGYLVKPPNFYEFKTIIERCGRVRLHQDSGDCVLLPAA